MHLDPKCNCKQAHKVTKVCINPICRIPNPFMSVQCKKTGHDSTCQIITYKQLIRRFHKIKGTYTNTFLKYQERVQSLFEELMGRLKKQFVQFRQQFEYFNITQNIENIYRMIKQNRQQRITAADLNIALNQKTIVHSQYKIKNQLQLKMLRKQIIDDHFNEILDRLPRYYSLKQTVPEQDQDNQQNKLKNIKQKFNIQKKNKGHGLLDQCYDQFEKMVGRPIFSVQLLYKASKRQFSAQQFHKKCDRIPNTLTMAKTQYGNIVGGFCPFPWKSPLAWQYIQDSKKQCFLFSLNKKLRMIKLTPVAHRSSFAIGMHRQYGPCFGDDFVIYDKANHSKSCWSNFPDVYSGSSKDGKKLLHQISILKAFVGTEEHYQKFNLLDWQVYKINFLRSQQVEESFMQQYNKI